MSSEAFIKTPKQLITVVTLSFIVPIIVIALLVNYVNSTKRTGAGSEATTKESIENRIKPVAGFQLKDASGPAVLRAGSEVYKVQCSACHDAGAANAPKFGDTGAWAARIKTGYEALLTSALKGKGAMAAQGGGEYSDVEIGRAVVHMTNAAGAKFAEPAAPAAAPATAAPAPAPTTSAPAVAAPIVAAPMAAAAAAPVAVAAAAPAADKGKALYEVACAACHNNAVAGAPKFADKAAWAPRIKDGVPHLVATVIKGKGAMPAKGGKADATEADIKAAVEYMIAAAK
jgi:cytochrome c5